MTSTEARSGRNRFTLRSHISSSGPTSKRTECVLSPFVAVCNKISFNQSIRSTRRVVITVEGSRKLGNNMMSYHQNRQAMRSTTDISHSQLSTRITTIRDLIARLENKVAHLPRYLDRIGGCGRQGIELIVDDHGGFERVHFLEVQK